MLCNSSVSKAISLTPPKAQSATLILSITYLLLTISFRIIWLLHYKHVSNRPMELGWCCNGKHSSTSLMTVFSELSRQCAIKKPNLCWTQMKEIIGSFTIRTKLRSAHFNNGREYDWFHSSINQLLFSSFRRLMANLRQFSISNKMLHHADFATLDFQSPHKSRTVSK